MSDDEFGGSLMDDSFPSIFSEHFHIYEKKQNTQKSKKDSKFTFLVYAFFNYILNVLRLTLDLDVFFVKGKTYKSTLPIISNLNTIRDILTKFYHCYSLIIRVYDYRFKPKSKYNKGLVFALFDDMTNTKKDNNTKEIEILIKNNKYYLFDKEDNFLSKRFYVQSIVSGVKILSENR